jgi:hypothetical protein
MGGVDPLMGVGMGGPPYGVGMDGVDPLMSVGMGGVGPLMNMSVDMDGWTPLLVWVWMGRPPNECGYGCGGPSYGCGYGWMDLLMSVGMGGVDPLMGGPHNECGNGWGGPLY